MAQIRHGNLANLTKRMRTGHHREPHCLERLQRYTGPTTGAQPNFPSQTGGMPHFGKLQFALSIVNLNLRDVTRSHRAASKAEFTNNCLGGGYPPTTEEHIYASQGCSRMKGHPAGGANQASDESILCRSSSARRPLLLWTYDDNGNVKDRPWLDCLWTSVYLLWWRGLYRAVVSLDPRLDLYVGISHSARNLITTIVFVNNPRNTIKIINAKATQSDNMQTLHLRMK
ncbi:uncharacterized protein B0H18DRAFT_284821 [Fomitopsis serialis]|uniref:uncharacterized protein n=1 Tax=Fomitopsis serialis TaxID=139415 RepID=UPI0020071FDA|nr:uncharacterized protein B0H18DRAFT_284821 [Neoantrodia serialis]KAH9927686.1 hypothetical protein B0H18DRAFT_284821 [Neoantrodia serialis]